MTVDACTALVVEMNGLAGADQILAGQDLQLPGEASPSSRTRSQPSPTPVIVVSVPTEVVEIQPEPTPEPEPATVQSEPQASLVAISPAQIPTTEADESNSSESSVDPTPGDPTQLEGDEYVVESGDSLLGICLREVPEMDEDECIEFTALLNGLDGPDAIWIGQVLVLP